LTTRIWPAASECVTAPLTLTFVEGRRAAGNTSASASSLCTKAEAPRPGDGAAGRARPEAGGAAEAEAVDGEGWPAAEAVPSSAGADERDAPCAPLGMGVILGTGVDLGVGVNPRGRRPPLRNDGWP
jgi:hypothetical protein